MPLWPALLRRFAQDAAAEEQALRCRQWEKLAAERSAEAEKHRVQAASSFNCCLHVASRAASAQHVAAPLPCTAALHDAEAQGGMHCCSRSASTYIEPPSASCASHAQAGEAELRVRLAEAETQLTKTNAPEQVWGSWSRAKLCKSTPWEVMNAKHAGVRGEAHHSLPSAV